MIHIRVGDRLFEFPSLWDELRVEDILFFCRRMTAGESITTLKPAMALKMLGLKVVKNDAQTEDDLEYFDVVDWKNRTLRISAYALHLISEKLDFMFAQKKEKSEKKQWYVNSRLTLNPVPELKVGKAVYFGPKQSLSDISFHRFILSEHYYAQLVKSGDPGYLDKLLGVLYLEKGESFSEETISVNPEKFKKIPAHVKYAIRLYYEGSKMFLTERFPFVFGGKKSSRLSVVDGYMKIVNALSGNDVTKHDQIRASPLYEVLYSLNDLIEKNEKL